MSGKVQVVNRLGFSADGAALGAAGWRGFQVWRPLGPGARTRLVKGAESADRFAFVPGTSRAYAKSFYNTFHVDLDTGRCDELDWGRRVYQFAVHPDGTRVLFLDYDHTAGRHTLTCRQTDPAHTFVWGRQGAYWGQEMQFLPSGKHVLGMFPDYIRKNAVFGVFDIESGTEVHRSNTMPEYSNDTVVSPDERLVACVTRTRVRLYPLWERFTEPLAVLQNDTTRHFTGIAFHPTGRYLAATSNDRTVKLYDTNTWEVARVFTWDIGKMRSVCFSPDGNVAASGSDAGKIVVWDVDA